MGEKLLKIYELGLKYTKTNVQRVPWTKYLQRHQILNVGISFKFTRRRIHEHTNSLRFLDIILRVHRLEVSVYNVYITNQFPTTFARGRGGGWVLNLLVEVTANSKEENS
jgi:hypothetical protein